MIAVDTNLLVYAHHEDSPWHEKAYEQISDLAEGVHPGPFHGRVFRNFWPLLLTHGSNNVPTPLPKSIDQIEAWLEAPNLSTLPETEGY